MSCMCLSIGSRSSTLKIIVLVGPLCTIVAASKWSGAFSLETRLCCAKSFVVVPKSMAHHIGTVIVTVG